MNKNIYSPYHLCIFLVECLEMLDSIRLFWDETAQAEYSKCIELMERIKPELIQLESEHKYDLTSKEALFSVTAHKLV